MEKIYKIVLILFIIGFLPLGADAAALSFSPASGSHPVGSSFTVGVYVGSIDQAMNAASGVISFPKDMMEVVSISKTGSLFTIWAEEPVFSNSDGTVSFEGLIPNPGFTGSSGKVLTVTFKVKSVGTSIIRFSSSSALANDGKGTNILTAIDTAQFTFGLSVPTNNKARKEKSSYFDVAEVSRQDETDPRAKFIFDTSDDAGIDHYEIMIDGVDLGKWKKEESDRYEAPVYGPGKHTIIVKALDKAGNTRSSTSNFFIKGLDAPIFTTYSKNLQSEEMFSIQGTTYINGEVRIWIEKRKDEPRNFTVQANKDGQFIWVSEEGLMDGVYDLWAEVVDKRGARSLPTDKITIVVSKSAMFRIGGMAFNFLSLLIPLMSIVFVLIVTILYGWRRLSIFRKRLRTEVEEAESTIHKFFNLMKEDIKGYVEMLEKTNGKRELTKEKEKTLKQLRRSLRDAEKFIAKEIRDIEDLI
ncbi:MAG: hypothetical protein EXS50_02715 [Candidatus Taylorbacteria bacterium]|nr:hypothetical protein [Candidatus Taylorbacteria bacterium]